MTARKTENSTNKPAADPIAQATQMAASNAQAAFETLRAAADAFNSTATSVGQTLGPTAFRFVEQGTEKVGQFVTPIAENPLVKYVAKLPGINYLFTALGNVDPEQAQKEVDKLRQEYPLETPAQLANRIIVDTALKGGGIGLLTNFIPPLALTLFAVDIAAITTLQAEMVYRIAAAYGFSLKDPTRRGEVLAIFALSVGGTGTLKVGLSFVELIPILGAVVGASSNAGLLYTLGHTACGFYEAKRNYLAQSDDRESKNDKIANTNLS